MPAYHTAARWSRLSGRWRPPVGTGGKGSQIQISRHVDRLNICCPSYTNDGLAPKEGM